MSKTVRSRTSCPRRSSSPRSFGPGYPEQSTANLSQPVAAGTSLRPQQQTVILVTYTLSCVSTACADYRYRESRGGPNDGPHSLRTHHGVSYYHVYMICPGSSGHRTAWLHQGIYSTHTHAHTFTCRVVPARSCSFPPARCPPRPQQAARTSGMRTSTSECPPSGRVVSCRVVSCRVVSCGLAAHPSVQFRSPPTSHSMKDS